MKKLLFTSLAFSFLTLTLSDASELEKEIETKEKKTTTQKINYKPVDSSIREIDIPEGATYGELIAAIEKKESKKVSVIWEKRCDEFLVYPEKETKISTKNTTSIWVIFFK